MLGSAAWTFFPNSKLNWAMFRYFGMFGISSERVKGLRSWLNELWKCRRVQTNGSVSALRQKLTPVSIQLPSLQFDAWAAQN